jgi:hypothetical protein
MSAPKDGKALDPEHHSKKMHPKSDFFLRLDGKFSKSLTAHPECKRLQRIISAALEQDRQSDSRH